MKSMVCLTPGDIAEAVHAYATDFFTRYSDFYSPDQLQDLRHAAVMMPLFRQDNEWHILLTKRAETLDEHRGQVAFPGGAHESQDHDLRQTALREMQEEIGIDPADVHVFGFLGDMPVVTGYLVRPYVGQIPWPYALKIASDEVHSAFTIPLNWLADPKNRRQQTRIFAGREFPVVYFDDYDGYQLWGASAEMVLALLSALHLMI